MDHKRANANSTKAAYGVGRMEEIRHPMSWEGDGRRLGAPE